jgi:hypothetical protein
VLVALGVGAHLPCFGCLSTNRFILLLFVMIRRGVGGWVFAIGSKRGLNWRRLLFVSFLFDGQRILKIFKNLHLRANQPEGNVH